MHRQRLLHLVNGGVAVGLAVLVVWATRPWEAWQFDRDFLTALAVALAIDIVLVWVWAQRHSFVLTAAGAPIPPRRLVPLVLFSGTANSLTPAASGEVLRAWFLKRDFGLSVAKAGGAIVFERFFMFGLMTATAVIAILLALESNTFGLLLGVAALAAYLMLLPSVLRPLVTRIDSGEATGGRIRRLFRGVVTESLDLWGDGRVVAGTGLWSLAAFACHGVVFWLAGLSSGLTLSAAETWAVVGGGTAVGVLSTLPFGLGAAELTAAGIGALLGLDTSAVTASFLVFRLFLTFPLALAGAYAYGRLTIEKTETADER